MKIHRNENNNQKFGAFGKLLGTGTISDRARCTCAIESRISGAGLDGVTSDAQGAINQ